MSEYEKKDVSTSVITLTASKYKDGTDLIVEEVVIDAANGDLRYYTDGSVPNPTTGNVLSDGSTLILTTITTMDDFQCVLDSTSTVAEMQTFYLDTTDAYETLTEADNYFTKKLNATDWTDSTGMERVRSILESTSVIDRLNFLGKMTDEDQSLQFPRYDDATTPDGIKNACSENCIALLSGIEPDIEFENLGMVSQGYANIRSTYNRSIPPENLVAGIVSITAWRMLKPYLRDQLTIDLNRVS